MDKKLREFAYKMQLDALNRQGERSDLQGLEGDGTSNPIRWKLKSA